MTAMPSLTGTHSTGILAEAATYRNRLLAQLDNEITTHAAVPAHLRDQVLALYREVAIRQTDFAFWLDRNYRSVAREVASKFTAADKARLVELNEAA